MKARAWSTVVALLGILALLLLALSIWVVAPFPVRGTVIRHQGLYRAIMLPAVVLAVCIAEFIRFRHSARPLWLRAAILLLVLGGLLCSFLILPGSRTVRESDTRILWDLRLIDPAIDAHAVPTSPSPR